MCSWNTVSADFDIFEGRAGRAAGVATPEGPGGAGGHRAPARARSSVGCPGPRRALGRTPPLGPAAPPPPRPPRAGPLLAPPGPSR